MSTFVPLYRQIMNDIREQIATGELAPGDELPSTAKLAEQYRCAPGTVRDAINRLMEAGVLRGHQGRAVYVADRTT